MGGGVGYYTPRYGLLIDNILEYEMIDAKGNAVVASATQNPELFWGIRGMGAGNCDKTNDFEYVCARKFA